jgi:hypothetical protein
MLPAFETAFLMNTRKSANNGGKTISNTCERKQVHIIFRGKKAKISC